MPKMPTHQLRDNYDLDTSSTTLSTRGVTVSSVLFVDSVHVRAAIVDRTTQHTPCTEHPNVHPVRKDFDGANHSTSTCSAQVTESISHCENPPSISQTFFPSPACSLESPMLTRCRDLLRGLRKLLLVLFKTHVEAREMCKGQIYN